MGKIDAGRDDDDGAGRGPLEVGMQLGVQGHEGSCGLDNGGLET